MTNLNLTDISKYESIEQFNMVYMYHAKLFQ